MAEFCLACWNQIHKSNFTKNNVTLTKYLELCEGCGKYERTIYKFYKRFSIGGIVDFIRDVGTK